jgi:hypothetical protein
MVIVNKPAGVRIYQEGGKGRNYILFCLALFLAIFSSNNVNNKNFFGGNQRDRHQQQRCDIEKRQFLSIDLILQRRQWTFGGRPKPNMPRDY